MFKDLIAQIFCREIGRKLRRLGVLGAIVGVYFAVRVELPLEISVATKEAQVMVIDMEHSVRAEVGASSFRSSSSVHLQSEEPTWLNSRSFSRTLGKVTAP